jgi:aminoglycoside phosphotransferase (APT) family kinase protein
MHADEVHTDARLVRRLLAAQFPQWASLPIKRVASSGTDNALYRLGDELVARLPRIGWAVGGIDKSYEWLPRLAPLLPVAVPEPVAKGTPDALFPWPWAVYRWLGGETPTAGAADGLAHDLARVVRELQRVELADAPQSRRGRPLATQDEGTRQALAALTGSLDVATASAAWERALQAPPWTGRPTWTHGDLMPGNVLLDGGRLAAIIDWDVAGVGDPAADLAVAWTVLSAEGRAGFRAALDVDDATWERGRGWALSTGLIAIPYYKDTNPGLADNARYRIREILSGPG